MKMLIVLCLLFAIPSNYALYDNSTLVISLTEQNFEKEVLNSWDTWLINFFVGWCPHCKRFVNEYEHIAAELDGFVKVGAVNAEVEKGLKRKYGIRRYPTLMLFKTEKSEPVIYKGPRKTKDIINFIFDLDEDEE